MSETGKNKGNLQKGTKQKIFSLNDLSFGYLSYSMSIGNWFRYHSFRTERYSLCIWERKMQKLKKKKKNNNSTKDCGWRITGVKYKRSE